MAQLADWLDQAMAAQLTPLGFQRVRLRKWVRAEKPHIHEVFEFYVLKSSANTPRWGFSLPFAPRADDLSLASKGTPKTARMDICYDPIWRNDGVVPDWCSLFHIPDWQETTEARVSRVVAMSVQRAQDYFARVHSLGDIVEIFKEEQDALEAMLRKNPERKVWSMRDLAWGLAMIARGDPQDGEMLISKFCETFGFEANDSRIERARQRARTIWDSNSEGAK